MCGVGAGVERRVAALSGRAARARAGAAMIEAVIVLPVLLMTFAGVLFMRERYLGQQQALLAARRCAWAHAIGGCGEAPAGCRALVLAPVDPDRDSAAIVSAARAQQGEESTIDVFDDIPVLGKAIAGLFGTHTVASALARTAVPWDRERQVSDRFERVVLCNEQPRDVLAAARNVFCRNVPLVPCDEESEP
jgi:hypothetical protein